MIPLPVQNGGKSGMQIGDPASQNDCYFWGLARKPVQNGRMYLLL